MVVFGAINNFDNNRNDNNIHIARMQQIKECRAIWKADWYIKLLQSLKHSYARKSMLEISQRNVSHLNNKILSKNNYFNMATYEIAHVHT